MKSNSIRLMSFLFLVLIISASLAYSQTTEFTYQGSLKDGVVLANGNYDFEFALYDALSGGTQLGSTLTRPTVAVANGVFLVKLDFGNQFPGANRFLEIHVRPTGGGAFTPLAPRQQVNSAPYSVKAVNADNAATAANATQLGGVVANQYVLTGDARLSDARPPTAGSANYVQNTTSQQSSSNFNISGNGTANIFNATTQYNIGGSRVLSVAGAGNIFAGVGAGTSNTTGGSNSFFGANAGQANTLGALNSFFGVGAGDSNTTGGSNSFVGSSAGQSNLSGISNSFFGVDAGFFSTTGDSNSFFGAGAGQANSSGGANSFFGRFAGLSNTTGGNNTIIGSTANVGSGSLNFATALGAGATVNASNTLVLGRTVDTVQVPGNLNVTGTFSANINGASITNLNASNITSGTLDNARLGVVPVANGGTGSATGSGAGLTNLNASNITSGTLDNARLGVVPIANGGTGSATQNFVDLTNAQTIGGDKTFSNTLSGNIVNATTQFNIGGSRVLSVAGTDNVFVGVGAGQANTGISNAFFGKGAGVFNTMGDNNAFFGSVAGALNTVGDNNAFFGFAAGQFTTGTGNAFFGKGAGYFNSSGTFNTLIGLEAEVGASNLTNATALGSYAFVSESNSLVLGSINGVNGAIADTNVGIGTTAPVTRLHVNGNVRIDALGVATANPLCFNLATNVLSFCSSSLRYKKNVDAFGSGLSIIRRLRPVTFDWNETNQRDIGLIAEEVEAIEPLLATYNKVGQIQGVKYDQLSVVFINAVKEQQAQIEAQQRQIDALTKLICTTQPQAEVCQEKKQ